MNIMKSPSQQPPSFMAPTPSLPSRSSFAELPPEIRHQIWSETMEPRILCLNINQHVSPATRDSNDRIDSAPRTLSIAFDCSVVPASPSNVFDEYRTRLKRLMGPTPSTKKYEEYNEYAERHAQLAVVDCSGHILSEGKKVLQPMALYICQESRALALQRYQRAFGKITFRAGIEFFWNPFYSRENTTIRDQAVIGEPKIYIDFQRDIIVVDSSWEMDYFDQWFRFPQQAPFNLLSLIRIFLKEESKNIQRLGVAARDSSSRDQVIGLLKGCNLSSRVVDWNGTATRYTEYTEEWLFGFDTLKELILDDIPTAGNYRRPIPPPYPPGVALLGQPLMTLDEELLHYMGRSSATDPSLAEHPPKIRLVRTYDWSDFL
jgi:2EXR family